MSISLAPIDYVRLELNFETSDGVPYIKAFFGIWLVEPEDEYNYGIAYTLGRNFVLYCEDEVCFRVYDNLDDMEYLQDIPRNLVSNAKAVFHLLMGGPGLFVEELDI